MTLVVPSKSMKAGLETATAEYAASLPGSPGESLLLDRGITKETIEKFHLGYVSSPISGHERFIGHIAIPYITVTGIVSLRFRRVGEGDGPKYLSALGESGRPFNVRALRRSDLIFVTEGEMDSIVGEQAGMACVGFPGAQSWKRTYQRLFRFKQVFVLCDGDTPGLQFGEAICKDVEGAKVIEFPLGEDVNSIYLRNGADYLRTFCGISSTMDEWD